jgi:aminoglycoside phosphotransferase (APT) family kinase protein
VQEHLDQVGDVVNRGAVLDLWERVVLTSPRAGAPVWIHGDLHPGNLVVSNGRLSAVIDFGDLCAGDPSTDLAVAWMLLPQSARSIFRSAYGPPSAVDDDIWIRALGWALTLGLAHLAAACEDERRLRSVGPQSRRR